MLLPSSPGARLFSTIITSGASLNGCSITQFLDFNLFNKSSGEIFRVLHLIEFTGGFSKISIYLENSSPRSFFILSRNNGFGSYLILSEISQLRLLFTRENFFYVNSENLKNVFNSREYLSIEIIF